MTSGSPQRLLSVIVCGAGPATAIGNLIALSRDRGWAVQAVATPAALDFIDPAAIEIQTGNPVRSQYRASDSEAKGITCTQHPCWKAAWKDR